MHCRDCQQSRPRAERCRTSGATRRRDGSPFPWARRHNTPSQGKGLLGCSHPCCVLAGRYPQGHLHWQRSEKHSTKHRKSLHVALCNRLWTSASRRNELRDGLVLMTKMKKLNLCSFLHLVKEIMHFPQRLMPAPQGLYHYLLFCLLK